MNFFEKKAFVKMARNEEGIALGFCQFLPARKSQISYPLYSEL